MLPSTIKINIKLRPSSHWRQHPSAVGRYTQDLPPTCCRLKLKDNIILCHGGHWRQHPSAVGLCARQPPPHARTSLRHVAIYNYNKTSNSAPVVIVINIPPPLVSVHVNHRYARTSFCHAMLPSTITRHNIILCHGFVDACLNSVQHFEKNSFQIFSAKIFRENLDIIRKVSTNLTWLFVVVIKTFNEPKFCVSAAMLDDSSTYWFSAKETGMCM